MKRLMACLFLLMAVVHIGTTISCRGYTSPDPPVHPLWNMDTQQKGVAYRESTFFENNSYMQEEIAGTVRRGMLNDDEHFYEGKVNEKIATTFPKQIELDLEFLKHGQKMYNRHCQICHSAVGDGKGMVGRRLIIQPTTFHSEYMYNQPPGHFFDVITHGIRNMKAYGHQIPSHYDRWAIAAHVRVLQLSQDPLGEWIKRSALSWKQP